MAKCSFNLVMLFKIAGIFFTMSDRLKLPAKKRKLIKNKPMFEKQFSIVILHNVCATVNDICNIKINAIATVITG